MTVGPGQSLLAVTPPGQGVWLQKNVPTRAGPDEDSNRGLGHAGSVVDRGARPEFATGDFARGPRYDLAKERHKLPKQGGVGD